MSTPNSATPFNFNRFFWQISEDLHREILEQMHYCLDPACCFVWVNIVSV